MDFGVDPSVSLLSAEEDDRLREALSDTFREEVSACVSLYLFLYDSLCVRVSAPLSLPLSARPRGRLPLCLSLFVSVSLSLSLCPLALRQSLAFRARLCPLPFHASTWFLPSSRSFCVSPAPLTDTGLLPVALCALLLSHTFTFALSSLPRSLPLALTLCPPLFLFAVTLFSNARSSRARPLEL